MPIFDYQCLSCDKKFSELRKMVEKDETINCPECGKDHSKRLITGFAVSLGGAKSPESSGPSAPTCAPTGGFG